MSYQQHPGASDQTGRRQAPPYPLLGTNGAAGGRAPAAGVYGMPQYTQVTNLPFACARGKEPSKGTTVASSLKCVPNLTYDSTDRLLSVLVCSSRCDAKLLLSRKRRRRYSSPLTLLLACSHLHAPGLTAAAGGLLRTAPIAGGGQLGEGLCRRWIYATRPKHYLRCHGSAGVHYIGKRRGWFLGFRRVSARRFRQCSVRCNYIGQHVCSAKLHAWKDCFDRKGR